MPRFELRCTDEERDSWKARASAEGLSVSEWFRRLADGTPEPVGTPVPVSGTPRPVRDATVFAERAKKTLTFAGLPARNGKLDPRCVQAQYHWKGFCKVCG